MKHLFLITIGPVQSFIAQARKTQDLYAGSQLLSYLVWAVMQEMKNKYEVKEEDFIFPICDDSPDASRPNRVLAIVRKENIAEMGEYLENHLNTTLKKIALDILLQDDLKIKISEAFYNSYENQLNSYLQIYWVAIPYDGEKENYAAVYSELERLLGGIKNIRHFEQLEEVGRKDSMSGDLNALFYSKDREKPPTYLDKEKSSPIPYLNLHEGLSAIGLLKRFYDKKSKGNKSFPSTAKVALMDTLTVLPQHEVEGYFKLIAETADIDEKYDYKRIVDAQLLFKSNLTKKAFEKIGLEKKGVRKEGIKKPSDSLSCFTKSQKKLVDIAKEAGKSWHTYYATVMFDGDNMGKWLKGGFLENKEQDLYRFHCDLSSLLSQFATHAQQLLDTGNKGRTVYAGGDDFLGFVTLPQLFPFLKEIRQDFKRMVNDELQKKFKIKRQKEFTISAGVMIAHYKENLSNVLKWTRKMEKEAKNKFSDKNALAIAIMRHSGNINHSIAQWQHANGKWQIDHIEQIIEGLSENFSNTFISVLDRELNQFQKPNRAIVASEIDRLVIRSWKPTIKDQGAITTMQEQIKSLYQHTKSKEPFLNTLSICDFINRKTKNDD